MRRYDIVSGILLILSILDFTLAAPIFVQEKRQAGVDVVHLPREVKTMLGKRVVEDLEKLAEDLTKTLGKPIDSSDTHASSSSAPPGPDHGSTNVVQGPAPGAPNPASSTANPGLLMEPSSPSSTGAIPDSFDDHFNTGYDRFSNKGSASSLEPMFTPGSSEYGSDNELAMPKLTPIRIRPSPGADPNFDWEHWQNAPSPPKPSSPNEFGLAPEYQMGHVQQPNAGPLTGPDPGFDWEHWQNAPSPPKPSYQMGHMQQPNAGPLTGPDPNFDWEHWQNALSPPKPSSPNEFGLAPEHQVTNPWATGPDPGLDSNRWVSLDDLFARPASAKENTAPAQHLDTKPDSDPNLMAAHQPPPYPLSSTEFGKDHDVNQPLSYAPEATDFYSYSYPGSVAHPPSLGAGSSTVPEHEEVTPSSPNLGSPKEPENEVVPRPPPTPESSDPQSLSTAVQPEDLRAAMYGNEDLQASMYAAKGKGKESRSITSTAGAVGNAAQRELQPAERSP